MIDRRQDRDRLQTEQQNPVSAGLDKKNTGEILSIINKEDKQVALAVEKVLPEIEIAVGLAIEAIESGGRVIYMGAGTSGRLGVLDASEIPPTFSAPRDIFTGLIAGGRDALVKSIEGAEDDPKNAIRDLKSIDIDKKDLLIGIASSSTTPYVIEGLKYSRGVGASTVFLICNPDPLFPIEVDVIIPVDIGQEIITGSTRMKSGTATKMVLNSISTTTMIGLGKVYDNLMVDLMVTNKKLEDRGRRIISMVTGIGHVEAGEYLVKAGGSVKTAIAMVEFGWERSQAEDELRKVNGRLRHLLERE